MKRLLPLLIVTTFAASTDAQVSIGNRAGLSISHQESDKEDKIDPAGTGQTPLSGLSVGLILESKIKPFLAAQFELGLTQKGRQLSEPKLTEYYRMRLNYAEGQFLAKGIIGKGPTKLNLLAGISFGRGLVGTELGEFSENDSLHLSGNGTAVWGGDTIAFSQDTTVTRTTSYLDRNIPFNSDRNGGLAITEWSFVGGVGVSFDVGKARLFLEGRYVHGLNTIYNGRLNEPDVFNRSIIINFGYLVQLNDPKNDKPAKPEAPQY